MFDKMSFNEEDGINSNNSKENSAQMMEQVTDPECNVLLLLPLIVVLLQILNFCWTRRD